MKTYCTAQGTLLGVLWWPKWTEIQKGGDMCVYVQQIHFAAEQKLAQHCKATICQ